MTRGACRASATLPRSSNWPSRPKAPARSRPRAVRATSCAPSLAEARASNSSAPASRAGSNAASSRSCSLRPVSSPSTSRRSRSIDRLPLARVRGALRLTSLSLSCGRRSSTAAASSAATSRAVAARRSLPSAASGVPSTEAASVSASSCSPAISRPGLCAASSIAGLCRAPPSCACAVSGPSSSRPRSGDSGARLSRSMLSAPSSVCRGRPSSSLPSSVAAVPSIRRWVTSTLSSGTTMALASRVRTGPSSSPNPSGRPLSSCAPPYRSMLITSAPAPTPRFAWSSAVPSTGWPYRSAKGASASTVSATCASPPSVVASSMPCAVAVRWSARMVRRSTMIVPAPSTGAVSRPCQTTSWGGSCTSGGSRSPCARPSRATCTRAPGSLRRCSAPRSNVARTSRALILPAARSVIVTARRPCGCSRGPSTSAVSSSDPSSGVAASSPSGASSPDLETGARGHPLLGQIDPAGAGQRRPRGRGAQLLDRQLVRSGLGRGQPQLHALAEQTGDRGRAKAPAPDRAFRRHGPGRRRLRRARPVHRRGPLHRLPGEGRHASPRVGRRRSGRARSCRQSGGP